MGRTTLMHFDVNVRKAVISGTKFADANGNMVKDPGEAPIEGSTVYLDSNHNGQLDLEGPNKEIYTVTDVNGRYAFRNLPLGVDYRVTEVVSPGWMQTLRWRWPPARSVSKRPYRGKAMSASKCRTPKPHWLVCEILWPPRSSRISTRSCGSAWEKA